MVSTAVSSVPVTSRWYGQSRARDVARRLESLSGLSPAPGPAGVITARRDELTVTFVEGLKAPLPQPWQPAGREAQIGWEAIDPGHPPDPEHPVYLVVFGTTDDGGLVGLNLAAFPRIRVEGDPDTAAALIRRWVLELMATHPAISIGVTDDVWKGPWTTRVQPVAPGRVPGVDVLVCGPGLTYAERAQIVAASTSPILIDLGQDAAMSSTWVISCGPDRLGQISRGASSRPLTATLIVPSAEVVDRCAELLTDQPEQPIATPEAVEAERSLDADAAHDDDSAVDATGPDAEFAFLDDDSAAAEAPDLEHSQPEPAPSDEEPIDFFAPMSAPSAPAASPPLVADHPYDSEIDQRTPWPAPADELHSPGPALCAAQAAPPAPARPVAETAETRPQPDGPTPVIAPIWNRILGQVVLQPPHSTQEPGPREKRLNELTVFLQHRPWASATDIIGCVYGGAASEKTVTQQLSLLRARLGVVRPGGPKALPPMSDGGYHLDNAVRSDWMEFERLVEILVETTPTPNLIGAMDLVTGPPLSRIPPKEWAWTKDLREELRDRVPAAAVALARRHHEAKRFGAAVEIARKGLWYDNVRQDLWQVALSAALDGHDKDAFRALRGQFLATVTGPDRDPAVFDLTRQAG
ncbi:bacterial transcriptional activator domain-containing protein [Mycobacterium sp. 1245852.3]|uniref:bacterial transcriptional activator domain-containing protein n=1 Tax=Mycobacterium sp. 1245852.3 TaxID=1856860 RepID=UPI0007FE48A4|nr:bacterial transcriptional activator domain-containing protein [Mycobacterium sp. 1245852.3]OBJ84183.1 hypothetical protein A9W96_27240 [Mycobacterium sp. 1245852.3]